jgi:N-acetyl-anhydromuramoyl-L-alanine amidase
MTAGLSGRHQRAVWIPSPNCDARPPGVAVELIVIHNISLPPGQFGGEGVAQLFTNRLPDVSEPGFHPYYAGLTDLRVSAHFLIARSGKLTQFVDCGQRAWHAGASSWRGRERCNDYSIGIELEGTDHQAFTEKQYLRLNRLIDWITNRYPVMACVGHSDIAPGRKTDPGPHFDWRRVGFSGKITV